MMDQQQIGAFIQERRKAHSLTQQELADRLGVTNKAVSKWEKGRSLPDAALFEPLCRELEISIPELLAGHRIDAGEQQHAAEELLMESISRGKLVGLQAFLMINTLFGVVMALSPLLFPIEKPVSWLLTGFGLLECVLVVYFDCSLPGRETRRQSFAVRVLYSTCLFFTLGVLSHPSAVRERIPLRTEILALLLSCFLALVIQCVVWRFRSSK